MCRAQRAVILSLWFFRLLPEMSYYPTSTSETGVMTRLQEIPGLWALAAIGTVIALVALGIAIAGFVLANQKTSTTTTVAPWVCGFYNLSLQGICTANVTAKLCKSGVMASVEIPRASCTAAQNTIFWGASLPTAMDPGLDGDGINDATPSVPTLLLNDTVILSAIGLVEPASQYPIVALFVPLDAMDVYIPPVGTSWGIYSSFQLVYATNNTLALPTPDVAFTTITSIAAVPTCTPFFRQRGVC